MKTEKHGYLHNGKERTCTIEYARTFIATDTETGFSGHGSTLDQAVNALVRNLDTVVAPSPRQKVNQ